MTSFQIIQIILNIYFEKVAHYLEYLYPMELLSAQATEASINQNISILVFGGLIIAASRLQEKAS